MLRGISILLQNMFVFRVPEQPLFNVSQYALDFLWNILQIGIKKPGGRKE